MIKLGIIGTGRIAKRFIPELNYVERIKPTHVFNPNRLSAERFANEFNCLTVADSLENLLENVDAIYIASPHQTHSQYIEMALLNGCHVLCEKPMVLKKREAERLFELADNQGLILIEGIKTAYCPGFLKVLELVKSGIIGDVVDVEATFTKLENLNVRELNDRKWGGALTELASYTLLPIIKILGTEYSDLRFEYIDNQFGIDIYSKIYLKYKSSFAISKTGLGVKSEGQLIISGTKGYILVEAPWWKTSQINVRFENINDNIHFKTDYVGEGLRYEINEFVLMILKKRENQYMRNESITIAGILEDFLKNREELCNDE